MWIIATLLVEMKDLQGRASFESCDTKFGDSLKVYKARVEAPNLWMKLATFVL